MIQDLRFYDFDFNLLHIQHDVSGVHWNLRYNGIGTFEGEFSPKSTLCALCMKNTYLVVCQGEKQAIITGKFIKNNKLILYGRTVNFLLSKRVAMPFSSDSPDVPKDIASLAGYIVNKSCSDFITLGNLTASENCDTQQLTKMASVSDTVFSLLEKASLGHRLFFDIEKKKWIFDILKGEEKNLIISEELYNAFDCEYTHSLLDYYTSGYYAKEYDLKGDWNPAANSPPLYNNLPENYGCAYRISENGTYFGISFTKGEYLLCKSPNGTWEKGERSDRFWVYVEGKTKGALRWDAVLDAQSNSEAEKILHQNILTQKISSRIKRLEYGKDFSLGDIIRFTGIFGNETVSFNLKITAVDIWYENSNTSGIKPEFSLTDQH